MSKKTRVVFKFDDLKANPRNPRKITDEKLELLRLSLARFGDLGGIVFNQTTGHLVGGHQRVEAFKTAGKKAIVHSQTLAEPDQCGTVLYGYAEVDGVRFSYRAVKWDLATESAAMLAANKHSGEFDKEGLATILRELETTGPEDLKLTGFDSTELDMLLDRVSASTGQAAFNYKEQFGVIVVCKTEAQQKQVYDKLLLEGYEIKVVTA